MRWEYLLVLAATVLFPLLRCGDRNLPFRNAKLKLLQTILIVSVPFWIWDVAVTARGHWSFNVQYVIGYEFLGLPLEEWLFFVVVAFVSVFVWESTRYFVRKE